MTLTQDKIRPARKTPRAGQWWLVVPAMLTLVVFFFVPLFGTLFGALLGTFVGALVGELSAEAATLVRERFERCLEVDRRAQRRMSTNFLPVGDRAAIVPASAVEEVGVAAEAAGRRVEVVDLTEIQKGGGSVRCSTCLLESVALPA